MTVNLTFSKTTVVCDVEGALLRSSSTFPYFMLVAFEGGGLLRALVLLLLYPLIWCSSHEVGLRIMVMVSFCGLRKEGFRVGRSVLPKYFLEDVGLEGFELVSRVGRVMVGVSAMPRVMVEVFLKEYLEVKVVVGRELKVFGGFFTGFMEEEEEDRKEVLRVENEVLGEEVFGFVCASRLRLLRHYFPHCKKYYMVAEAEKQHWKPLPGSKYPKPLIFHDGRLAFRPTAPAMLAMFLWVPLGLLLAVFRLTVFVLLPYGLSIPIVAFFGLIARYAHLDNTRTMPGPDTAHPRSGRHHLYVCNHRTLLDPIYISAMLKRKMSVGTYSVSRLSELLSPIPTVRLTRKRDVDRKRLEKYLRKNDLVVCPEGTTCREPYLLRFSPLFAELADEVVPTALMTRVGVFHGTTAGGLKWLDPFCFLMNPRPEYEVKFLERMSTAKGRGESWEVANSVQRELGRVLGWECTAFTRKDKYLLLAGNEGIVEAKSGWKIIMGL